MPHSNKGFVVKHENDVRCHGDCCCLTVCLVQADQPSRTPSAAEATPSSMSDTSRPRHLGQDEAIASPVSPIISPAGLSTMCQSKARFAVTMLCSQPRGRSSKVKCNLMMCMARVQLWPCAYDKDDANNFHCRLAFPVRHEI